MNKIAESIKYENFMRAVKFVLFSCTAGIIQIISFTLLFTCFIKIYWPSYFISLVLSVLYNFTVNRRYTFMSATNIPKAMLKVFGYYCVFTPVSIIGGNYFTDVKMVNDFIVLLVTMFLNLLTEFLFCRFVVYRDSVNTNEIAKRHANKSGTMDKEI